jgi:hypothetical protein
VQKHGVNGYRLYTYLRCDDHLVVIGGYKAQKHGVYDDLYRGHGSHHPHVVHHQESVSRQIVVPGEERVIINLTYTDSVQWASFNTIALLSEGKYKIYRIFYKAQDRFLQLFQ